MKDGRIIREGITYELAQFDGVNRSGYEPMDDRVLVLLDLPSEKSAGGVRLPFDVVEKHTMASENGVIVAIGPAAFAWNESGTRPWTGERPAPGDRVFISRYAGQLCHGDDGRLYRIMDSRCIGARKVAAAAVAAMEAA